MADSNPRYLVASISDKKEIVVTVKDLNVQEITGVALYLLKSVKHTLDTGGYADMAELVGSIVVPLEMILSLGNDNDEV